MLNLVFKIGDKVKNVNSTHEGVIVAERSYVGLGNTYQVLYENNTLYWCDDFDLELIEAKEEKMTTEQYIDNINATLNERGQNYGKFENQASICQALKKEMQDTPNWHGLDSDMKEALEMIQHKVARILNGNPYYRDSWHDISGYATLIADRLDK